MDKRIIRIVNPDGWPVVNRRGISEHYPAGDYVVPEDMAPDIAQRCLNSNYGKLVQQPLETKHNAKKPRKKKRSKIKTGKRAQSSPAAPR